jgi:hypothetical protein
MTLPYDPTRQTGTNDLSRSDTDPRSPGQCWLWPDRTIGKVESRILRDEHNALVNESAALREQVATLTEALRDALGAMEASAYHCQQTAGPTCCYQRGVPSGAMCITGKMILNSRAALARAEQGSGRATGQETDR